MNDPVKLVGGPNDGLVIDWPAPAVVPDILLSREERDARREARREMRKAGTLRSARYVRRVADPQFADWHQYADIED